MTPPKSKYIILNRNHGGFYVAYVKIGVVFFLAKSRFALKRSRTIYLHEVNKVSSSYCQDYLNVLLNFYLISNLKIRFSGKGYKLVKYAERVALYLNTSHTQWLFLFKSMVFKIQKQKYLIVNLNKKELSNISQNLVNARPLSIYTKRGLRASRQDVFKKIGKRSA